jgi:hypothetical protein
LTQLSGNAYAKDVHLRGAEALSVIKFIKSEISEK